MSNVTPSPVWLCFFLSGVLRLLGYRRSNAGNFTIDDMILHQHGTVQMEHAGGLQHPAGGLLASGEKDGGELG